jgi:hypothetical protein
MKRDLRVSLTVLLTALALPAAADAQAPLGLEVRGGLNWAIGDLKDGLGDINQDGIETAQAEQHGWTASADVFWAFHQRGAMYVGWNWAKFDCKDEECGTDGLLWSQGPEFGFKISTSRTGGFSPWVRFGGVLHQAKYKEGDVVEERSNRTLGLDFGVGTDLRVTESLSIVPAVRFYRYNAAWDVGSIGDERVKRQIGWFQTDLGLNWRLN